MGLDEREFFLFLCAVCSVRVACNVGHKFASYIVRKPELTSTETTPITAGSVRYKMHGE